MKTWKEFIKIDTGTTLVPKLKYLDLKIIENTEVEANSKKR